MFSLSFVRVIYPIKTASTCHSFDDIVLQLITQSLKAGARIVQANQMQTMENVCENQQKDSNNDTKYVR